MQGCAFYCFGTRRQQILMTKSWCFSYQGVLQFLAFHSVQFAKFWIIPQCTVGKRVGISLTKRIFFKFTMMIYKFKLFSDASIILADSQYVNGQQKCPLWTNYTMDKLGTVSTKMWTEMHWNNKGFVFQSKKINGIISMFPSWLE